MAYARQKITKTRKITFKKRVKTGPKRCSKCGRYMKGR